MKAKLKAYQANKWEKGETKRELYRLVPKILKQRLRVYSDILKTFFTIFTQIYIGKVALKSYFYKIKHAPNLKYIYKNKQIG